MIKDKKYRTKYVNSAPLGIIYKSIFENVFLPEVVRLRAFEKLSKIGKVNSKIKNRCVVSGRTRGIIRGYKISRSVFKEYVRRGYLSGVSKKFL